MLEVKFLFYSVFYLFLGKIIILDRNVTKALSLGNPLSAQMIEVLLDYLHIIMWHQSFIKAEMKIKLTLYVYLKSIWFVLNGVIFMSQ